MTSIFTEEHREFERALQTFIDREIEPFSDEWEEPGRFPAHELFRKLGEAGFLGATKPIEFGGLGLDHSYSILMAEVMGGMRAAGVALSIGVQTDMATPALAKFGNDRVRSEFLVPAIAGQAVACIGVSEPWAGSDVASIRTTARKDGDDYVINGTKMWITNGTQADWVCLLANTEVDQPTHRSKTLICVPLNSPGVSRAPALEKLGMRASDTTQLFFEDVRVPRANRIGEEGHGFRYQMIQFQEERLWGAANVLRALERVIEETARYCTDRRAFGGNLMDFQVVSFKLAEMSTEVELLRALVYRATAQYVAGEDVTRLATMAKLKAGRTARLVTDACLQFWGAAGFMWDAQVARAYRDLRLVSIGGGADEIMLQILTKIEEKRRAEARS